jgi:hypothetical protein
MTAAMCAALLRKEQLLHPLVQCRQRSVTFDIFRAKHDLKSTLNLVPWTL